MKISLGSKSSPLGAAYAKRSPIYQIAALSGMALLLVVVATLQYKSATQLSAATEVRLGNNLQLLMTGWHRDLYDELSAGCIAMQVGPDSGAHDAWNDYLQRYAEWSRDGATSQFAGAASASSEVVREVYVPWVCPSFLLFCVLLLCSFPALAQSPQPSGAPNATAQEPSPFSSTRPESGRARPTRM